MPYSLDGMPYSLDGGSGPSGSVSNSFEPAPLSVIRSLPIPLGGVRGFRLFESPQDVKQFEQAEGGRE